jgi:hypothetical protein
LERNSLLLDRPVGYDAGMGKQEILNELEHLSDADRFDIQAKLDQLAADRWQDGDELSDEDRHALDGALRAYQSSPDDGKPWEQVRATIAAKLGK